MKIRCLLPRALRLCSVLSLLIATVGHTQTPLINPTSDGGLPPLPQIVSISTVDAEAEEPPLFPPWTLLAVKPNTAIFKISRIGATDFDLPVHYRVEGSAKNGEDYEKLSGGTTILKGQSATLLEIVPLADALVEGSESVAIILEVPVCIDIFPPPRECYILGTSTAGKAIILDTPTGNHNLPPKVEITNPASGQSFEAPDSILVEAKTVDADGYAPYVEFFSDGAKIGDSQIVFIQAPKPGTILTHDFLWKAPSAGVHELVAIAYDDQGAASKSSAVVIKVTPVHPFAEVNIVANDPEAVEPRTPLPWEKFAINKGQFTVFRSGPTDLPLTVQLRFGGTASMGLDYEKVASGVTIPPGTNSTTIEIYPINDQIIETTETVQATIVPFDAPGLPVLGVIPVPDFSPYTIGARSTDVVKILDNGEGPLGVPEVNVVASDPEATEPPTGDPNVKIKLDDGRFTISRTGRTTDPLGVYYSIEGSATSGADFAPLPGLATIAAGSASVDVQVLPLFDRVKEGDESVVVHLIQPPYLTANILSPRVFYTVGASAAAKMVIHDNGVAVENRPPKADIVHPASGATFQLVDVVKIEVQTADADGYVPWVEFFAGKQKIGDSRIDFDQAPDPGTLITHSLAWHPPTVGEFSLMALAHDDQGATTESTRVVIKVTRATALPEVSIVATDSEAAEPRTPLPWEKFAINKAQFTISRTGSTDHSLTVQVGYRGTAVNGVDYERLPNWFTIPEGTNGTIIDISPINDQLIEPTETVEVTITPFDAPLPPVVVLGPAPSFLPYRIGKNSSASATILDNGEGPFEIPEVSVVASDAEATEPPTNDPNVKIKVDAGRFTISRTGRPYKDLEVWYAIEGTATSGEDFTPLASLAVIPMGMSSVDVEVLPLFDRIPEGDESVVLTLIRPPVRSAGDTRSAFVFYTIGTKATAKVVIHDNAVGVDNRPPKADIVHPAGGTVFHLSDVVEIVVQTADADGYVSWVEFFAGKEKIGDSHIYFFRAPDPGTLITHSLAWHPTAVGEFGLTAVAHDDGGATTTTAIVVIKVVDNSQPTVVAIRATDAEGAEPDPVAPGMGRPTLLNPLVFEITRKGDLSVPIVVFYHLDGTAKNGHDYDLLPGRIEIPKGESSVRLMVSPIDDDLVEGDESIAVILDAPICRAVAKPQPGCYTIADGAGIAKGIIHDNDPNDSLRPTLTITAPDAIATEGKVPWASPTATFAIHRQGPTHEALTVGLKVAGTALSGKDYEALPESVVIPAGERSVKIVLKPVDDTEVEGIETVWVELLPPDTGGVKIQLGWPAYRLGRPSSAIAVILDNDQTRPPCRWLSDGHFHLCVPGIEGAKYRLETSDDLKLWTDAGPVETADGAIHYVDPSAPGQHVQFYRVVPDTDTSTP